MKSKKVCVIAIATMKTTRKIGFIDEKTNVERVTKNAPIRFMWMPGVKPVRVPKRIPTMIASKT